MTTPDPRLTPARPDLAASHLEGRVNATKFVAGVVREVVEPQAPVRRHPAPDASLDTEALCGERVVVYETTNEGWCWGQLESDGYVGWLPEHTLAEPGAPPTHKVNALRTLVFAGPSIKLPPVSALPFGARIAVARMQDRFAVTTKGGYLPAQHMMPIEAVERDFVAVAERFVGVPYLWGGKTALGLDCSGLVQVALTACGLPCPRDSDMQETTLGRALNWNHALGTLRRGDLVFWPSHVAIIRDRATLLHANAHHMAVAIEPTADAFARIAETTAVRCVKRL